MKRVVLESPFQGKPENVAYARRALADSLRRGEAPIASHLLYPGTLDDSNLEDRSTGLRAGHAWIHVAELLAVYTDRGITPGMEAGIKIAEALGLPIVFRELGEAR